jgi:dihydrofolate reductase
MGTVLAGMMMSLDGFIQDRNGSVARLYPDLDALRQTDVLQEASRTTKAVVMGRRAYDMAQGDCSGYEFQVPIFVLTHAAPQQVVKGENHVHLSNQIAEATCCGDRCGPSTQI